MKGYILTICLAMTGTIAMAYNQLEYIAHFDEGELLGHTVYEPLKPEDY